MTPDPPALDGSRTMKVHSALQATHRSRQLSKIRAVHSALQVGSKHQITNPSVRPG